MPGSRWYLYKCAGIEEIVPKLLSLKSPMPSASGKRNTARNQPVFIGLPFQILAEIRMRE